MAGITNSTLSKRSACHVLTLMLAMLLMCAPAAHASSLAIDLGMIAVHHSSTSDADDTAQSAVQRPCTLIQRRCG